MLDTWQNNSSAVIGEAAAATARRWWVLHTKPRMEKLVADALHTQEIAHYLPLIQVRHTYEKSKVTFEKPLFPSYVFLLGDERERIAALQTNRLVRILEVVDQRQFRGELDAIRAAVDAGTPMQLFPALRTGTRCRVSRGPLRGVEGVVEMVGDRAQVFVAISALGQSAVLEIDSALLERID